MAFCISRSKLLNMDILYQFLCFIRNYKYDQSPDYNDEYTRRQFWGKSYRPK